MESIRYGYGHFRRNVCLEKAVASKILHDSGFLFWMTGPVHISFDRRNSAVRNVYRNKDLLIQQHINTRRASEFCTSSVRHFP